MLKRKKSFSPVKIVSLGFVFIILLGATLLCLPISAAEGETTGFVDALFTATSAVCVTGLAVHNTALHWSAFGKGVILLLVQIGGLGFMTMACLVSFVLGRKISFRERMVMAEALNSTELRGVVRLTRKLLLGTIFFEGAGALILTLRFMADFPFGEALVKGVFHSVSAFCNAGFDLFGDIPGNSSLAVYVGDPVVNLTVMFLVVTGGLGFFVWTDLAKGRSFRKMHTQSKLVLLVSAVLLVSGGVLFFAFEYSNPATMKDLPLWQKLMASFFQSVTCRTAGFETVSQASLSLPSKFVSVILMFIGGSPGSTAGGIKTVTLAVLVLAAVSEAGGKEHTNAFGRRISPRVIRRALAVVMLGVGVVAVALIGMSFLEPDISMEGIVFEVVSAIATVGLSCSVTPLLGTASKLLVILLMYFGRVGILTVGMSLAGRADKGTDLIMYADADISVG